MNNEINLYLPWPPSINHYWRHTKNSHYISAQGKDYRTLVFKESKEYHGNFQENVRLSLYIEAYPPDRRKRDLDNVLKSLLDALQNAEIYRDDNQIDCLSIIRKTELKGGVHIFISIKDH